MRNQIAILFQILITFTGIKLATSQIVINEFQASNASTILDFHGAGDHSDWIELYNTGFAAVELDGWYLTDNKNESTKWRFV